MGKSVDRNKDYMMKEHGTDSLATDYGSLQGKKMLREISNDEITPRRTNIQMLNDLYEKEYTENHLGPSNLTEF